MAGSLKDALQKSGLGKPDPVVEKPKPKAKQAWRDELPDDKTDYMPFEKPAVTKVKE